jgi:hypothetical protein
VAGAIKLMLKEAWAPGAADRPETIVPEGGCGVEAVAGVSGTAARQSMLIIFKV